MATKSKLEKAPYPNAITILTSEIKIGDRIKMGGGHYYDAISDAYKHKGIWSFDFHEGYRYGFQSQDTEIQIYRNTKK